MLHANFEYLMYQTNRMPYRAFAHTHTCYELVYYLTGDGITKINNLTYQYELHTFSIVEPHHLHSETASSQTEVIFIGFSYSNAPFELKSGVYADNERQDILNLLLKMKQEMIDKSAFYNDFLRVLTQAVLIEAARLLNVATGAPEADQLSYALKYLNANYSIDVDLEAVAELSGYSYHHFRHLFKEKTGLPPKQFMLQQRINRAKSLLAETEEKVTVIASECGFSNDSQLIKYFRKIVGETPMQYRAKIKKNIININYVARN